MSKINKQHFFKAIVFLVTIITFFACSKAKSPSPELTVSASSLTFAPEGGSQDITIISNADWSVSNPALSWLQLSSTSGKSGSTAIHVTAISPNGTGATQSAILTISSSNGQARRVTVTQAPNLFPTYNISPIPADAAGMSSTAVQLAANITMGYNIYNTMEAQGSETGWGNPLITQSLIDLIKQSGMNAVRIPIQYDWSHIIDKKTARIDPVWLARVKQVVQYCYNDNMYVMVNIHWDGGWLECTATGAKQDSINAKQKAYWEQIATTLRGFDEHLMFASSNEPDAQDDATTATLMRYHQTFINAVRSTGGKNTYRTLIIQAPSTNFDLANKYFTAANTNKATQLPTDPTPDRMMMEAHYYSPPNFCILSSDASWGKEWYFWGKNFHTTNPLFVSRNSAPSTEEHYVDSILKTAKVNFTSKGIPIIMGEYGTSDHFDKLKGYPADSLLSVNSQMHFYSYVAKQAKANGVLPFLWAGDVFNRQNNTVGDQRTLDSLKKGGGF